MELHLRHAGQQTVLKVAGSQDALLLSRPGEDDFEARILETTQSTVLLEIDGQRQSVHFWRANGKINLQWRGQVMVFELEDPDEDNAGDAGQGSPILRAPMPGKVLELMAAVGDAVQAGQPLVRLEAMKMEIDLAAPMDGTVETIRVAAGDLVEPDAELMRLQPHDREDNEDNEDSEDSEDSDKSDKSDDAKD